MEQLVTSMSNIIGTLYEIIHIDYTCISNHMSDFYTNKNLLKKNQITLKLRIIGISKV